MLEKQRVPVSPVLSVAEAVNHPHLHRRGPSSESRILYTERWMYPHCRYVSRNSETWTCRRQWLASTGETKFCRIISVTQFNALKNWKVKA